MRTKGCDVDERDWLAKQFEQHRPHLRAVAYRMLGSVSEAEDAVQESWLRLARSEADGVAHLGGRTPTATRQLGSRARRRVRGAAPRPDADPVLQREVVGAFLAASRAGDFEGLLAVLDPDVVFRVAAPRARPPVTGAAAVARAVL